MENRAEVWYELMRKEANRLKTFQMNPPWPADFVDIKKLAKAGFFYTFNGDRVLCAFCRGQLCTWERNDDPMSEHARNFTTCPFIMGGEVGNEPLGEDPFPGPKRPRPYDVCGIYSTTYPPPQDDMRSLQQPEQQQPLSPQLQRQSFDIGRQQSLRIEPQQATLQSHQQQEIQSQPQFQSPIQSQQDTISSFQPVLFEQQHIHQSPAYGDISTSSESSNSSSRHSPISLNSNCESNSSSSLNGICKICYTNSIELVFLPCGHSASCLSCAERLHVCPCCRATITTRIRTFLV